MARDVEAAVSGATSDPVVVRLVVSRGSWLYQTYGAQLDAIALDAEAIQTSVKWTSVSENNVVFDNSVLPKLIELVRDGRSRTIALRDSRFQSWRYFHPKHTAHVMRQFTFPNGILRQLLDALSSLRHRNFIPLRLPSNSTNFSNSFSIQNMRDLLGIPSTASETNIATHIRLTDHSWNIGTRIPSKYFFQTVSHFFNKHFSNV